LSVSKTALLGILLLVACGGGPPVQSQFNPEVDFTEFKTFTFAEQSVSAREGSAATDSRVLPAIRETITADLSGKSMRLVETDADLSISVTIILAEETAAGETGYYWDPRGATEGGDSYVIKEGTLILDFFETAGDQRVWRSIVNGAASRTGDPDLPRLKEFVLAMLAEYPPAAEATAEDR